jgi:hypothetical protein
MCKIYRVITIVILLLSVLFCSFTFIPGSGNCQASNSKTEKPIVTMDLLQESQTAHVGLRDTCKVIFNGTVTVKCDSVEDLGLVVLLFAEDTWGNAKVWPRSLFFRESGERSFNVECQARYRESRSHTGSVNVRGNWHQPGKELYGVVEPTNGLYGTINIAQFHEFTLKSPMAFVELESGDEYLFNLTVQNRGNGLDVFKLNIKNLDELKNKGYEIILEKTMVEIQERSAETHIMIYAKTPANEIFTSFHSIIVEVTSEKGLELGVEPYTFKFVIRIQGLHTNVVPCSIGFFLIFIIILIIFVKISKYKKKKALRKLQRKYRE